MILSSALDIGKTLVERLVPDKAGQAKAIAELERMEQQGELDLLMGQLEANRQEAAHPSIFVAGWRPFVGWVCAIALANNYLLVPYLSAAFPEIIPLDMSMMMPVLLGMLGLGGMRSFEKFKGVARQN